MNKTISHSFPFFPRTNFKKVPTYTLIWNFKPWRVLAKALIRAKLQSPNIANLIFSPSFIDFLMNNGCLCLLILFSDRNSFKYLDIRHRHRRFATLQCRAVASRGAEGALAPPEFRSSVNPIPARGGRLCPPHYCQHPRI